jgi:hypothetical protein
MATGLLLLLLLSLFPIGGEVFSNLVARSGILKRIERRIERNMRKHA